MLAFALIGVLVVVGGGVMVTGQRGGDSSLSAQQTAAAARLEGRVLDGVTGEGLVGVSVAVRCAGPPFTGDERVTVAGGRFAFEDLPPGRCPVVSASRTGYYPRPGETMRPIDVRAGETVERTLRLDPAGAIEGRVVDDRGAPIPDVPVYLAFRGTFAGTTEWAASPTPRWTDPTGRFQIAPAGSGPVTFVLPTLDVVTPVEPVVVRPGESLSDVEIRGRIRPVFQVSGRLQRSPESRRSLDVFLEQADATPAVVVAEVTATAEGAFVFPAVPRGTYRLRVDSSRRIPADVFWANQSLDVGANVEHLTVPVRLAATVRGSIRFEGDSAGLPGRVLLAFESTDGRSRSRQVRTDTQTFETNALAPGRYLVRATGIPAGWQIKSAMTGGIDVSEVPLDFTGDSVDDIVLTYTDRRTGISGVVRTAQGQEDGGATVFVFSVDDRFWTGTGPAPRRVGRALTSQRGRYEVWNLPPGDYFAAAVPSEEGDGLAHDAGVLGRLSSSAARIRLVEGEQRTLDLQTVGAPR